jgi:acetylornithine deacetylase/succinyl-diaminopimelate desuccinylase-like protein
MLLALVALAIAQPDWKAVDQETLRHFQALVRLDTSNPPGNEIRAVEYLRGVLEREGIEVRTFAKDPQRPNLVARLKGSGAKRPLLLMGHTDTVTVDPSKWKFGPFSAERHGGHIYGRGTLDDKDNLTAALMTVLLLKRLNVPLDRDVILLAEAAEEASFDFGIQFMVNEHWAEIDAEFCLAEVGSLRRERGRVVANLIATAEKVPRRVDLVARGPAGHGSRPTPDNAVLAISEAVAKVARWRPPVRLNDTTRAYFERLAILSPPEAAARYNALFDAQKARAVQEYFAQHDSAHYSMITTSITPTILQAGRQINVIPSEARAGLDIRALPDENIDAFYAEMRKVIGNPAVEIVRRPGALRPFTPPSRLDTAMFRALEAVQKRMYPDIRTLPSMSTGATDMSLLREKGMQCYGIGPAIDVEDAPAGFGSHSDQERILESALYDFVRYTYNAVIEVAAATPR